MKEFAIKAQGLGKVFKLYEKPIYRLYEALSPSNIKYHKDFHALRDISFTIYKGQSVGILGLNGAGKSTLLKILTGVLSPTFGSVIKNGKIGALLELGAGFNPEISGYENIFFQCAIHGLSKSEIQSKIQEIIDFADIGDFIHNPVKTYSSGMFVRLAFSIIINIDAEILIIDEALSVGDAVFTQKCMQKIRSFAKSGTLLFVSHDISSVRTLCDQAIWLNEGALQSWGSASEVSEEYLRYTLEKSGGGLKPLRKIEKANDSKDNFRVEYNSKIEIKTNQDPSGWRTGDAEILDISITGEGSGLDVFTGGESVEVVIKAKCNARLDRPIIGFVVRDRLGQDLFGENTLEYTKLHPFVADEGSILKASFRFELPMLQNGQFVMMASVANGTLYENTQHHYLSDALVINVSSSNIRYGIVGIKFSAVEIGVVK